MLSGRTRSRCALFARMKQEDIIPTVRTFVRLRHKFRDSLKSPPLLAFLPERHLPARRPACIARASIVVQSMCHQLVGLTRRGPLKVNIRLDVHSRNLNVHFSRCVGLCPSALAYPSPCIWRWLNYVPVANRIAQLGTHNRTPRLVEQLKKGLFWSP